jgi:hypothetical protein
MPTPSSGTISIQQINAEFGRGNNLNAYRGTSWFTPAGASGTFPSGAIAMSDFYNKQPNSPSFSFTISSNQTNANLRTLAVNAGWNQSSKAIATIGSGVYISSNSTGTPGLTVNGSFPGGVDLINNGFIIGMGGAGGAGSNAGSNGVAGGGGGLALSVSVAVTVTNNGTIGGGGGGGGGGGAWQSAPIPPFFISTYGGGGGGGGGRTGATNSSGGAGGAGGAGVAAGNAGGAGTSGGGGAGGTPNSATPSAGAGGAGGGWGSAGAGGTTSNFFSAGGGGAAGAAISGNSNITYNATGTRLGAIT